MLLLTFLMMRHLLEVQGATNIIQANVTHKSGILNCDFKFVYKIGRTRLDLRRSSASCIGGTKKALLFTDEVERLPRIRSNLRCSPRSVAPTSQ